MVDQLGWRSIFLVNLPLVAIGIALTWRYVAETRNDGGRHLDLPGQGLGILALIGLTGSIIEAGPRGVTDIAVLVAFAVGLAAFAAFLAVEARRVLWRPLRDGAVQGVAGLVRPG